MRRISDMLTPYEQLDCLMEAAAAIYAEIRKAQTRKDGSDGRSHPKVVGADEFTPIWVYVVCKCDARNLYAHAEIMWACGDPKALSGQAGYYLTQLSSALISTTDSLTYSTCAGTRPLVTSLLSGIFANSTTSVGDKSMTFGEHAFNIRSVTNRNNGY